MLVQLQHISYVPALPMVKSSRHIESLIAAAVGTLKPEMLTTVRNAVIAIIQQR